MRESQSPREERDGRVQYYHLVVPPSSSSSCSPCSICLLCTFAPSPPPTLPPGLSLSLSLYMHALALCCSTPCRHRCRRHRRRRRRRSRRSLSFPRSPFFALRRGYAARTVHRARRVRPPYRRPLLLLLLAVFDSRATLRGHTAHLRDRSRFHVARVLPSSSSSSSVVALISLSTSRDDGNHAAGASATASGSAKDREEE